MALSDEASVLRECLDTLGVGLRQVVREINRTKTLDDRQEPASEAGSYLRHSMVGLQDETLADYQRKNRSSDPLDLELVLVDQVICVSNDELRHIFQDRNGWKRFREMYPQSRGIVDFSRVGFNANMTQALVYAGIQRDWLMGHGAYLLYSRKNGVWVQTSILTAWIS